MCRLRIAVVSATVAAIVSILPGNATGVPITISNGTVVDRTGTFVIGYQFDVGASPVTINSLGAYDKGGDGLATAHAVGIWDSGTTALRTATVPAGTGALLDDVFRYVNVPALTLAPSTTYTVGAVYFNGGDPFNDTDAALPAGDFGYTDGPGVTRTFNRFAGGGTLVKPTSDGTGTLARWAGANATYDTTSTALFSVVDGPAGNRSDFTGTVGSEFTVGQVDLVVTDLGFEDAGLDGLVSDHDVGIWNSSGGLVASVNVQSGTASTLDGDFRYEPLTSPIVLQAGETYRIGGEVFSGGDPFTDITPIDFAISGNTTIVANRFVGGGFADPTLNGGGTPLRWAPANLIGFAVPEPATGMLILMGLFALPGARRRRSRGESRAMGA